jgi:hypothetical protein
MRVLAIYQTINLVLVIPAIVVAVNRPTIASAVAASCSAALAVVWLVVRKNIGVHV